MPSVKDNIKDITNGVKLLGNEAKIAAANTKSISNSLKFDSNNVELIQQRYASLKDELAKTTKYIEAMQKAQSDLKSQKAEAQLLEKEEEREKVLRDINKQLADYDTKLPSLIEKQKELTTATNETSYNQQLVGAVTQQVNDKFAKTEEVAKKVSAVVKKLYMQVKKFAEEAINTGTTLYSLSSRFNTSVEDIQIWNRTLQVATGQSDVFTNSLKKIVQGMSQVASGRGVAYKTALNEIGIAYKDIAELDTAAQFEAIAQGLANVENRSLRAAYAEQLLGESGQYLVEALENGVEGLEQFKNEAEGFGYLTTEDAEKLKDLNITIEKLKSQLQLVGAELVEAIAPTIETLGKFLSKFVVPIIKTISNILEQMGDFGSVLLVIGTASLIMLPKVITLIQLYKVQQIYAARATAVVGDEAVKAGLKMKAAFGWISVIISIVSVIGILIGSLISAKEEADDLNDSLDDTIIKTQGIVGSSASGYTATSEQISTKATQYETTIDVTIRGEGDTKLSDEQMVTTAQLTAAEVNKSLGELVK